MDTLQLARLARGDQGFHEAEVSFGGECDLHRHLVCCDKNPGHTNFTALSKFTIDDLPEQYRDPDIVSYIRAQAELTVRVTTKYTSPNRPDGYPFCHYRGKSFLRTGTGFVQYVYRNEARSEKPCPCKLCKASGNPKKEWAKVKVRTATHVVFDDEEAKMAVAELFYDDESDKKTRMKTVYGDNVRFGTVHGDWCDMRCITHDIELCDYLKDAWGRWRWFEMKVNEKYRSQGHIPGIVIENPVTEIEDKLQNITLNTGTFPVKPGQAMIKEAEIVMDSAEDKIEGESVENDTTEQKPEEPKLAIIVSHPHGCNKQVSIGQWCERFVLDRSKGWENSVYTYNTPTCPGSSGAPVWLLGKVKWGGFFGRHPHSGRPLDGLNVSAVGWDKVS